MLQKMLQNFATKLKSVDFIGLKVATKLATKYL
jgi:hypothetical protein